MAAGAARPAKGQGQELPAGNPPQQPTQLDAKASARRGAGMRQGCHTNAWCRRPGQNRCRRACRSDSAARAEPAEQPGRKGLAAAVCKPPVLQAQHRDAGATGGPGECGQRQPGDATGDRGAAQRATSSTGGQLIAALAVILTVHCARAASTVGRLPQTALFHAALEPELSIRDYLMRIYKSLGCSKECFILSLVYIDRLVEGHPDIVISYSTIHRLLITGILVASKYWDDRGYGNRHYAGLGGLQVPDLNSLELLFVQRLGWKLHVQPEEYNWYCDLVQSATGESASV